MGAAKKIKRKTKVSKKPLPFEKVRIPQLLFGGVTPEMLEAAKRQAREDQEHIDALRKLVEERTSQRDTWAEQVSNQEKYIVQLNSELRQMRDQLGLIRHGKDAEFRRYKKTEEVLTRVEAERASQAEEVEHLARELGKAHDQIEALNAALEQARQDKNILRAARDKALCVIMERDKELHGVAAEREELRQALEMERDDHDETFMQAHRDANTAEKENNDLARKLHALRAQADRDTFALDQYAWRESRLKALAGLRLGQRNKLDIELDLELQQSAELRDMVDSIAKERDKAQAEVARLKKAWPVTTATLEAQDKMTRAMDEAERLRHQLNALIYTLQGAQ